MISPPHSVRGGDIMIGTWSKNEAQMQEVVREEILKALWNKAISNKDSLNYDKNILIENKKDTFYILKQVLGLLKKEGDIYLRTETSKAFDIAILQNDFKNFKTIIIDALPETHVDKILAEIQHGEKLSLEAVDKQEPHITPQDIEYLQEYMQQNNITATVEISHKGNIFKTQPPNWEEQPVLAIHSVAKIFTGLLVLKMIDDGIMSEEALDAPIILDEKILEKLSSAVQQRLKTVTLKQMMLHQSGLGDYLDNKQGLSADIAQKLNHNQPVPHITCSNDLLSYGDKLLYNEPGCFHYSNLGMLLVGFAIEKQYQENNPKLGIDQILCQFAKNEIGMQFFENKKPKQGRYNKNILENKNSEYIEKYMSARFACAAGGYWTTTADLQKLGEWVQKKCQNHSNFKRLIETHGGEFYNAHKQAVEHSGLHTDTAHFYTSLKNGTTISVLCDQGDRAATNLVDMILKQTTWYKNVLHHSKPILNVFQQYTENKCTWIEQKSNRENEARLRL